MSNGRLPPLPPLRTWVSYFHRRIGAHPVPLHVRDYPNRIQVASRPLADEMVKSMKLRPGEVIIEAFSGLGALTRSLLDGGKRDKVEEGRRKADWWDRFGGVKRIPNTTRIAGFPSWVSEFSPEKRNREYEDEKEINPLHTEGDASTNKPKLVVATDPLPLFLNRGFGMDEELLEKDNREDPINNEGAGLTIEQSPYEDRLVTAYTDLFGWKNLVSILEHPLVAPHIPAIAPPPGLKPGRREWSDPAPPITVVCNMPQGALGEQITVQWVTSVIGAAHNQPGWIWGFGRMRFAYFVTRGTYDRLMAKPGEAIFCKLSVMARALYHIEPLAPYHHITNADKSGKGSENRPLSKNQESDIAKYHFSTYGDITELPRTITHPLDFYPPKNRRNTMTVDNSQPLPRPSILGVMLTPREKSLITKDQRDDWDYVLRHIFVRQAQKLSVAIAALGFNAASLMPAIEGGGNEYIGRKVSGDIMVRDMDVEDWARVVDVFSQWPFKPADLIMDHQYGVEEDVVV